MKSIKDAVEFKCFDLAKPLCSILDHHYFLSDKRHSDLFQQIWKAKLDDSVHAKLFLTFGDIATEIWDPVFSECRRLVNSVREKTIELKMVDKYFLPLNDNVFHHLKNLCIAMEICQGKKTDNFLWIQSSVNLMEQYWALCKQAKAAKIVLLLKDKLKLTGNFEIIEDVASRVETSMMDASLASIGRKTITEAKSFLDKFTEDKNKLDCLDQFAACLNIVEWMRRETKG